MWFITNSTLVLWFTMSFIDQEISCIMNSNLTLWFIHSVYILIQLAFCFSAFVCCFESCLYELPLQVLLFSIFTLNTVIQHYKSIIQSGSFNLASVSENTILTILKDTKLSKAAGLDNPSDCFWKDGARVLAKPITNLCTLSTTSGRFPGFCKKANLKPIT